MHLRTEYRWGQCYGSTMKLYLFVLVLSCGLVASGCGDSKRCADDLDCDDGNACTEDSCDPDTAACENPVLADATTCEVDGGPGVCEAGLCAAATCQDLDCDDGNPCTDDECDPDSVACQHLALPDATTCEVDGRPAACEAGLCVALTCRDLDCDDDNPCTAEGCDLDRVECTSTRVFDQTTCGVDGALGACDEGVCDLDQSPPSGVVDVTVRFGGAEVSVASYEAVCVDAVPLTGTLTSAGGDLWETSMTLPAGTCLVEISALDQDGETVCITAFGGTVAPDSQSSTNLTVSCNP